MKRLAVLLAVAACGTTPPLVQHPTDPVVDDAMVTVWAREIREVARDGDWILSREDLSRAAMYDAHRDSVIESLADVRETPLLQLLARDGHVIVVRPSKMTAEDEAVALVRARGRLGTSLSGSDLVYWASQTEAREGPSDHPIAPADLMQYGEIIYWSGRHTVVIK